jgi:Fungal Zn(2)-Cys(6) binuclear cluster domain
MSGNYFTQPQFHERPSQPSTGFGPGMRLPGVRELLLPDPALAMGPSTYLPQYGVRKGPPVSANTALDSFPPPPKRASESSIRTLQSDQSDFSTWRRQSVTSSTSTAMPAVNPPINNFMQASPQHLPWSLPQQKVLLTPRAHTNGLAQSNPYEEWSPGSDYTSRSTNSRSIAGQNLDSNEMYGSSQESNYAQAWHDAAEHPDWGTTKAGKPRKRLAQACTSCRHKKIRCYPNQNTLRCAQCERSQSDCRFERG